MHKFVIAWVVSLGLSGCASLPPQWGGTRAPAETVQKTQPLAAEPVLYARDGSIVAPDGSGASVPRRDVQNSEGTRTKLLELYERVVEERDRLSLTLTMREAELCETKDLLAKEGARASDFEARLLSTEAARVELAQQNLDLAGRLTTAQIRRLEAEKQWLELSLATPAKTVAASLDLGAAKAQPKATDSAVPAVKSAERRP